MSALFADFAMLWYISVAIFMFIGWMTGGAVARTWKPWWQVVAYALIASFAERFLHYFVHLDPMAFAAIDIYLFHAAVFGLVGMLSFRLFRTRMMIRQYPWLYQRSGLLGWRDK